MTMFEDFSFEPPRSPSIDSNNTTSTRDTSRSVSPTCPNPAVRYSVGDLVADLDRQRIRSDAQICYQSCESYANLDDDAGWSLDPTSDDGSSSMPTEISSSASSSSSSKRNDRSSPPRCYTQTRRVQRQFNTRLLCSDSHSRDIAALLSRMVEAQEQCAILPPPSTSDEVHNKRPLSMSSESDEGYDSTRQSMSPPPPRRKDVRRASDIRKTGTAINKEVRLRKDRPVSYRRQRSSEKV